MTFVADLERASEETAEWDGSTQVMPDPPAGGELELAWSREKDETVAAARYSWWWVIDRAAVFTVLAVLAVAGIIVVGFTHPTNHQSAAPNSPNVFPAPPDTPTPTVPAAPPAMPPDVTHQLTGDPLYLNMVNVGLAPIGMSVSNPAGEISDGHRVCDYIAAGHSVDQAVDEAVAGLPADLPAGHARTIAVVVVGAAVRAYCPHNGANQ